MKRQLYLDDFRLVIKKCALSEKKIMIQQKYKITVFGYCIFYEWRFHKIIVDDELQITRSIMQIAEYDSERTAKHEIDNIRVKRAHEIMKKADKCSYTIKYVKD